MARTQDPFQIPRAGLEIAPIAGLASINVNGSVGPVPATEFVGESTPPSARKVDASPSRPLFPPGGLMEQSNASLQRGRQG